ncbi:MAG TPA: hypothetical protein VN833_09170 [Candidatus Acidoferrales bacterium]|nr:hypothetical protein [Candidatus Acidoferrales bacterium]
MARGSPSGTARTLPPNSMSIIATHYDSEGRKIAESIETAEDFEGKLEPRPATPQVARREVFLAEQGTQRRPANPAMRWSEFFE